LRRFLDNLASGNICSYNLLVVVLGLETSGQYGSVALLDANKIVGFADHNEPNAHAEQLLPLVNAAMGEARCSRRDISRIAVGIGPGNFTGLRVGISFGQGLGIGLGIPIVGICSLAAMARAITANCSVKLIVRDARRDELFCAAFDNHGTAILAPRLIKRASLYSWLDALVASYSDSGECFTLAGDGLLVLDLNEVAKVGVNVVQNAEKLQPDAKHVAYLGAASNAAGWPIPEYIREVDAVLPVLCNNPEIGFRPFCESSTPRSRHT
jgi:tRNA threonylcarbamoyladenosine biosynthesis protein TsaB